MAKRQKFPPDMALAKFGLVKQLYERVRERKDKIVDRAANGKAIYGYREVLELSPEDDLETQLIVMEECAHAIYKESKDTVVYLVSADAEKHVAEAFIDGKSVWSVEHRTARALVEDVFRTFPKGKKADIKPPSNPDSMEIKDLQRLIDRKKLEEQKKHLEKYGDRPDFSELPETTAEQRMKEMGQGRPDKDSLYDPKAKFDESQTNVIGG